MNKDKLSHKVGNLEQLAYARRMTMTEGKACGMKVIDIDNGGGLSLTLLESRCLDIARLSYCGINMGFLSKAGLVSPQNYGAGNGKFQSTFQGGMLYTCGLENIGPAYEEDGEVIPIHGTIGLTPAEEVCTKVDWNTGLITICGKVFRSELFGKNIVLERTITIPLFESRIDISDTVINEGFSEEEILLLYHINFGHPMLSENLKLEIDGVNTIPRDDAAQKGLDRWNVFERPTPNRPEEVFYHDAKAGMQGNVAKIINSNINLGAKIAFDRQQLPHLVQWKSMASGDYALGIEPATARVGVEEKKEDRRNKVLKPQESFRFDVSLEFYKI